jgi:putative membrane protein
MAGTVKNVIDKATDTVGGSVGKMSAGMTTSADAFVESARIGDLYEVAAARIALARSTSEPVRLIARKMIEDHMAAIHHVDAALEMNETKGVASPPAELDARRKGMIKHLEEAPNKAFESTYLDQQVLAHEETVSLLRTYSTDGDNPQLRSYALATLPVVERHLEAVSSRKAQR